MIIYYIAGLVLTYGVMRLFVVFMGNNKTHDRLGALINVFVYVIAVFLPFNYAIGVVLFGLGALFMLSISFDTNMPKRLAATLATFAVLISVRAGLQFLDQNIEGIALFMLAALVFFAASSIASDIRFFIDKRNRHNQLQEMQEKNEEEKTKLIAEFQTELSLYKNHTNQQLENTLKSLDLFKLADAEASIKDLIARNKTDKKDA